MSEPLGVKHLPGRHNQQLHGRGWNGGHGRRRDGRGRFSASGSAPSSLKPGPATKPKPAPKPSRETPYSRGVSAFKKAGGSVSAVPSGKAKEVRRELDDLVAKMGGPRGAFAQDDRVKYTYAAIAEAEHDPDAILLVGRDKELGLSGALAMYQRYDPDFEVDYLYIEVLGSTGVTPGAGTALAVEAARIARERKLPVLGQAAPNAAPFWRKLGWRDDPTGQGVDLLGWSLDDLEKVRA